MSRRRQKEPTPPPRAPSLSPAPGKDEANDAAWLAFFLTASPETLRAFERAIVG